MVSQIAMLELGAMRQFLGKNCTSNHDLILILNHLIFSDFDFKSSEIPMILILKRIQNQNHFMTSYYNLI